MEDSQALDISSVAGDGKILNWRPCQLLVSSHLNGSQGTFGCEQIRSHSHGGRERLEL